MHASLLCFLCACPCGMSMRKCLPCGLAEKRADIEADAATFDKQVEKRSTTLGAMVRDSSAGLQMVHWSNGSWQSPSWPELRSQQNGETCVWGHSCCLWRLILWFVNVYLPVLTFVPVFSLYASSVGFQWLLATFPLQDLHLVSSFPARAFKNNLLLASNADLLPFATARVYAGTICL